MRILIFCALIAICLQAGTARRHGHRHRPHHPIHPRQCCPLPPLISDEIKQKCMNPPKHTTEAEVEEVTPSAEMYDEHEHATEEPLEERQTGRAQKLEADKRAPPPATRHHPHYSPCLMSCMITETGVVTDDKVDESKVHDYFSVVLKDVPDAVPVVVKSFETCANRLAESKAMWQENHPGPHRHGRLDRRGRGGRRNRNEEQCRNPHLGMLVDCSLRETFINCPDSIWKNNEKCNYWRDMAKNWAPTHEHQRRRGPHHGRFEPQHEVEHE